MGQEHPRVCGENATSTTIYLGHSGTSPRMRGKRFRIIEKPYGIRNIPAYAGKTPRFRRRFSRFPEHPRVCGENGSGVGVAGLACGTSPRMRGKRMEIQANPKPRRNIPAYAGKTYQAAKTQGGQQEHPRVCGENEPSTPSNSRPSGTSPRMRGKLRDENHEGGCLRNIPAYAGKTRHGAWPGQVREEHPRVCGENFTHLPLSMLRCGTSPRMRGKRKRDSHCDGKNRNIPAYAGKTYR